MLKRAARYADGFYPVRINAEEFAVSWSKITRYGEELGRDVSGMSRAIHLFYRIGSTREEALAAGETELNRRRGFEVSLVRRWQICLRDSGRLHKDGGEIPECRCRPYSVQRHDACI